MANISYACVHGWRLHNAFSTLQILCSPLALAVEQCTSAGSKMLSFSYALNAWRSDRLVSSRANSSSNICTIFKLKSFLVKDDRHVHFLFLLFFQICFSDLRWMLMMRLSRWQKCHGWQAYQPKIVTVLSAVSKRQSNQIWQPRTIMAIFENQTTKLS